MALSDHAISRIAASVGGDVHHVASFRNIKNFAHAVESEVRKQDEALIRQLVGAMEDFDDAGPIGDGWKSALLLSLLASARARLEGKP